MTEKQKLFCDECLANGLNATQAYLTVYKNVKNKASAAEMASRLLKKRQGPRIHRRSFGKNPRRKDDGCKRDHGAPDCNRKRANHR